MPTPAEFVSIPDAAQVLGCGRTTVYEYINRGDLHPVRHGRRSVLSSRELRAFAARLAQEAGVPSELYDDAVEVSV